MSIRVKEFGRTSDGKTVNIYRITNASGAYIEVLDYGCTLYSICVPDKKGNLVDVCLGYDTIAEYEANDGYFGAVIGRCANRIKEGKFSLNGAEYLLAVNDGPNHLHGGIKGYDKVVWNTAVASDRLLFTYTSPDGEEGYPGNLLLSVIYSFDDDNSLTLSYDGECDADTLINLTNHCYFNLNGHGSGRALDLVLQIDADRFTENDSNCLPTGRLLPTEGTPFDFCSPKPIGRDIQKEDINLKNGKGYDHNFVLRGEGMREVSRLSSEETGIVMTVCTTQPGLQFYSGNFLTDRVGKGGVQYRYRDGVCLETQTFPDAIHNENFPSSVLKKGEEYHHVTKYLFTVES